MTCGARLRATEIEDLQGEDLRGEDLQGEDLPTAAIVIGTAAIVIGTTIEALLRGTLTTAGAPTETEALLPAITDGGDPLLHLPIIGGPDRRRTGGSSSVPSRRNAIG